MLLRTTVILTSTAAVGFYTRFMLALLRECRPRVSGYWVRLRLRPNEGQVVELATAKSPLSRAA